MNFLLFLVSQKQETLYLFLAAKILESIAVSGTEKVLSKYRYTQESWITILPASSTLKRKKKMYKLERTNMKSIPFVSLPYTLVNHQHPVTYFLLSGPNPCPPKFLELNTSPKYKPLSLNTLTVKNILLHLS